MTLDFQHFFSFYFVRFSLETCLAPNLALLHLICVLLATKPCSSSNFHDHTMCLFETPFSKPSPSLPESIARGLLFLPPTHCSPLHRLSQAAVGYQTGACPATVRMPGPRFRWQRIRTIYCLKSACTSAEGGAKVDPHCKPASWAEAQLSQPRASASFTTLGLPKSTLVLSSS